MRSAKASNLLVHVVAVYMVAVNILLANVKQAHPKKLASQDSSDVQASMDKLVDASFLQARDKLADKLVNRLTDYLLGRVLMAPFLYCVDLNESTIGKSGHLSSPHLCDSYSEMASTMYLSPDSCANCKELLIRTSSGGRPSPTRLLSSVKCEDWCSGKPKPEGLPADFMSQVKAAGLTIEQFVHLLSTLKPTPVPVATVLRQGSEQHYTNGVSGEDVADVQQWCLELCRRTHALQKDSVMMIFDPAGVSGRLPVQGQQVHLLGLQTRPELNGAVGTVLRFAPPTDVDGFGRWLVQIDGNVNNGETLHVSVRGKNLVLASQLHAEKKALASLLACGDANLNVTIDSNTCMSCHKFFERSSLLLGCRIQLHQSKMTHTFIHGCCSCNGEVSTTLRYQNDNVQEVSGDIANGTDWVLTNVIIKDGRRKKRPFTLHNNGFELRKDRKVSHLDYYDESAVIKEYYADCESLLRRITNASFVKAFEHTRRASGMIAGRDVKGGRPVQGPAEFVHGDYTQKSAPDSLRQLLRYEFNEAGSFKQLLGQIANEESLLPNVPFSDNYLVVEALNGTRRYAIVTVWRPFSVVERMPLALVDATTIQADDLVVFSVGPDKSFHFVKNRKHHEWYYFPQLTPDEVILIKHWDSYGDLSGKLQASVNISTFALHSAFVDPLSPGAAPDRESIEVRVLIVY